MDGFGHLKRYTLFAFTVYRERGAHYYTYIRQKEKLFIYDPLVDRRIMTLVTDMVNSMCGSHINTLVYVKMQWTDQVFVIQGFKRSGRLLQNRFSKKDHTCTCRKSSLDNLGEKYTMIGICTLCSLCISIMITFSLMFTLLL